MKEEAERFQININYTVGYFEQKLFVINDKILLKIRRNTIFPDDSVTYGEWNDGIHLSFSEPLIKKSKFSVRNLIIRLIRFFY
ncbi:MAG: hypothetical protein QM504_01590 [Pseudomonadota bacterium]